MVLSMKDIGHQLFKSLHAGLLVCLGRLHQGAGMSRMGLRAIRSASMHLGSERRLRVRDVHIHSTTQLVRPKEAPFPSKGQAVGVRKPVGGGRYVVAGRFQEGGSELVASLGEVRFGVLI